MEFTTSIPAGKECSMCGDVGFSSELLRCNKCGFRWQHSYCSKSYPEIGCNWVCDWCFAAEGKESNKAAASRKEKKMMRGRRGSGLSKQEFIPKQWDALEFLLEVAQSCAATQTSYVEPACCGVVERQACSSKRTSARKLSLKKHQKWGLVSEKMTSSSTKSSEDIDHLIHHDAATKRPLSGAARTRYKLLADV